MNIFVLDNDPKIAAQFYCDKHVPKMVVELYQQLGSALRRHGVQDQDMPLTKAGKPLLGGYHNHPCTRWVGDSKMNFAWAYIHGKELCKEYSLRFCKEHFCEKGIDRMGTLWDNIPNVPMTNFAQAMPDEYRNPDAVEAYRTYYRRDKVRFAKWEKGRCRPYWF